jgi:lipopolysaccharide heptosyltransferase I
MRIDIEPKKILVLKPSALGDIVHSMPTLAALRRRFPDAAIHWVVARGLEPLLETNPLVNELVVFDRQAWKNKTRLAKNIFETGTFVRRLSSDKYDLVVDLQGLLRTGLMSKAAGAKVRIGFRGAREGAAMFYTHRVPVDWKSTHAVERYLKLVEALGCDSSRVEFPLFEFERSTELVKRLPERYAVMAPSAGKPANRWPAERFGAVAARLTLPVVVVGTSADAEIAEKVVENSGGNARSIVGETDIPGLAAVLANAEFVLANDTGPAHLAAAIGTPVAALFGPANPIRTRPYGDKHLVIQTDVEIPCWPCNRKDTCPKWKCFDTLTPEVALSALERWRPGTAKS